MVQPKILAVSDCDSSNVPTSMQPSSFNDPVLTFMQASTNSTPLHQTASQHPITALYLQLTMGTSTIPLQPQNPQDTQPQQLLAACTLLPQ